MPSIPGLTVDDRQHSHVLQRPLAAPRRGIMLHYDDSSRDDWAVEWFHDPRCTNGYTWLVLDDGRVIELALMRFHAWHADSVDTRIVGHDAQAIWTPATLTRRTGMVRLTALKVIAVLTAAFTCTLALEEQRLHAEQARAATMALREANVSADRDSTRTVATTNHRTVVVLGDSLRLVEKRAMQLAQSRDAIDEAFDRERRARYALSATIDSLHRSTIAVVRRDSADATRHALFDLYQPPYTIVADVAMPLRADTARIDMNIVLDPIPLDARMGCAAPNSDGIRTATISATAPAWATVRFDRLEQSPDLCASPALLRAAQQGRHVEFKPLVIGAGRIIRSNGTGSWGWFIGTGITL